MLWCPSSQRIRKGFCLGRAPQPPVGAGPAPAPITRSVRASVLSLLPFRPQQELGRIRPGVAFTRKEERTSMRDRRRCRTDAGAVSDQAVLVWALLSLSLG